MPIIQRTDSSVGSDELKTIFDFLSEVPTEYVMWVNGSAPFWTPNTLARAARLFSASSKIQSMTSVTSRKNWFWDPVTMAPAMKGDGALSGKTQDAGEILESTHAFHIFPKSAVLRFGTYWSLTKHDPYLFQMPKDECVVDVDDEEDFGIADAIMMWRETNRE